MTTIPPVQPDPTIASIMDVDDDGGKEKDDNEEEVRLWFKRVSAAAEAKQKWEDQYEVDRSHDYVLGFQRASEDEKDGQDDRKYQLNKILAALKVKIPGIFYYNPYFRVRATRSREDTPAETVSDRAKLLQDTINTITRQPQTRFKAECLLAVKEAQWAFGVIEDGYSADWGENPFAAKPKLIENEDTKREIEKAGSLAPVEKDDKAPSAPSAVPALPMEPKPLFPGQGSSTPDPYGAMEDIDELPRNETFFARHIPARQFLVSSNDRAATEALDWIGYWEWMYVEDVKRTPSFKNTDDLKATAKLQEGGSDRDLYPISQKTGEEVPPDMIRIWKIWDLRENVRLVLAEGHNSILKKSEYKYLPLHTLRMEVMPGEWYPVPPIHSQLGEQDEFNDSREFLRMTRNGLRPRFTYDKKSFSPTELQKLESDEFQTMIGVEDSNPDPIRPIQQPSLSGDALRTLSLSEQGFSEATGQSSQSRQLRPAGGTPTATEVTALQNEGDVRESYEQQEVADFLASVARGILSCAIEKMTLAQWVLMNSDPYSEYFMVDAVNIAKRYKEITVDQLQEADDALSWDVTVDIESMSPVSESQQANRLVQFLNLLAQQGIGRLLSLSPELLKRTMDLLGIRNATDQKAIAFALAERDRIEREMAMGAPGGAPGAPGPGVSPMPGQPVPPGPPGPPGGAPGPQPPGANGSGAPGAPPPAIMAAMAAAAGGRPS